MALFLLCSLYSLLASVLGTDCPDTWTAFHGSCYKFARVPTSYTDAEEYCRQHFESHLVHIETQLENQFIRTFLQDFDPLHNDYWLGMTDEVVEDRWVWQATDTPVNFTDWLPTEPQNLHGNEDCAVFAFDDSHFGWADVLCTTTRRPLCEISREDPVGTSIIG